MNHRCFKKTATVLACLIAGTAFAAGPGGVYQRDTEEGSVEITNVPETDAYEQVVAPSAQSASSSPQGAAWQPQPIDPQSVPYAPVASERSQALAPEQDGGRGRVARSAQDADARTPANPATPEQTPWPTVAAPQEGTLGATAGGGASGSGGTSGAGMAPGYSTGSSGVASAGTSSQGNSTLPANQSGSAAARVASAAAPVDPELAARLQQYRDLMVKEATTGTAPAQNTAVSRRYLMVDRATYMQNGGGAK